MRMIMVHHHLSKRVHHPSAKTVVNRSQRYPSSTKVQSVIVIDKTSITTTSIRISKRAREQIRAIAMNTPMGRVMVIATATAMDTTMVTWE